VRRGLALAALLALAACGRSQTLDVPVADTLPEEQTVEPPDTTVSYVSAPIVLDYRPLLADLETTVPRTFGSIEKDRRIKVVNTPAVYVAPELHRAPFRVSLEGERRTITLATVIDYRARAWAKVPFSVSVSCGIEGPRPRIRVKLAVELRVADDWTLRTRTRLLELAPFSQEERDQCEISALKIDVAGKIASEAGKAIEALLLEADRKARTVSLVKPVSSLWAELQKPIDIMDRRLWLHIRPRSLAVSGIETTDSTLTAHLVLRAGPLIVGGARPDDDTLSLPPLGHVQERQPDSVDVRMEGRMEYATATAILRKELAGRKLGKRFGRRVTLEDIAVRYGGGGRLLIAATIAGRANGTVYLMGTPTYDTLTDLITVPDLAFDVRSAGYLENVAGWLVSGPYQDDLRGAVKLPAGTLLEEVVRLANKEINRQLADGVFLRGELTRAQALGVKARRDGIVAQARGLGVLRLEIAKEDLIPPRATLVPGPTPRPPAAD
jgi:predicted small lipoprotein YifL